MLKKIIHKLMFVISPTYRVSYNNRVLLISRINNLETKIDFLSRTLENLFMKDYSLNSGEREVGESLADINESFLVRYKQVCKDVDNAKNVLDIASGVGYGSYILAQHFKNAKVDGVDISQDAINYAKKHYNAENINYLCCDSSSKELKDSYDLIVSFETIEHIAKDDEFLESLAKKLTDGGVMYLSTPNKEVVPVTKGNHFHYRHYTYDIIEKMAKKNNLKIVKTYTQYDNYDKTMSEGSDGMYLVFVLER